MNNESIPFKVQLKKQATKYVKKQDTPTRERLKAGILKLKLYPFENMDIEPLDGLNDWARLRIGKYRILFSIDWIHRVVTVEEIDTRGDIYKRY